MGPSCDISLLCKLYIEKSLMSLGVQSDPLLPTELGVGEGGQLQCQTEQKFAAKMQHVYFLIVG